jgi:cell division protease FtsH
VNKRWRNAGLYALLAIVVIALATAFFDKQPQTRETWKYSTFIQEVENKQVERVSLSADRSKALVTAEDGSKVMVNLPPDPGLIDILSQNNVDISVMPQSDEGFWFKALSSLFFPILLLVGLFFLLRRAQSGPGSQAMNFGKSKARVHM